MRVRLRHVDFPQKDASCIFVSEFFLMQRHHFPYQSHRLIKSFPRRGDHFSFNSSCLPRCSPWSGPARGGDFIPFSTPYYSLQGHHHRRTNPILLSPRSFRLFHLSPAGVGEDHLHVKIIFSTPSVGRSAGRLVFSADPQTDSPVHLPRFLRHLLVLYSLRTLDC